MCERADRVPVDPPKSINLLAWVWREKHLRLGLRITWTTIQKRGSVFYHLKPLNNSSNVHRKGVSCKFVLFRLAFMLLCRDDYLFCLPLVQQFAIWFLIWNRHGDDDAMAQNKLWRCWCVFINPRFIIW